MIDKQKAIRLRESGLTYREIAEELDCSEIWCKTNLKGIVKRDIQKEIDELCQSHISNGMVHESDVLDCVFKVFKIESEVMFEDERDTILAFVKYRNSLIKTGINIVGSKYYDKYKEEAQFQLDSLAVEVFWDARIKIRKAIKEFSAVDESLNFSVAKDLMER